MSVNSPVTLAEQADFAKRMLAFVEFAFGGCIAPDPQGLRRRRRDLAAMRAIAARLEAEASAEFASPVTALTPEERLCQ